MFHSSAPNYAKLKTNLRLAINRFKLLEKKKTELAAQARREIADQLRINKADRARIRVQHIIREDFLVEAMEMLEMYCDLLTARMGLLEHEKKVDPSLEEAITSLLWATPRLVQDVPELATVTKQFVKKYGTKYCEAARDNNLGTVNQKLLRKLSLQAPRETLVEQYLIEIARNFHVDYEADPRLVQDSRPDASLIEVDSLPPPPPPPSSGPGYNMGGGGGSAAAYSNYSSYSAAPAAAGSSSITSAAHYANNIFPAADDNNNNHTFEKRRVSPVNPNFHSTTTNLDDDDDEEYEQPRIISYSPPPTHNAMHPSSSTASSARNSTCNLPPINPDKFLNFDNPNAPDAVRMRNQELKAREAAAAAAAAASATLTPVSNPDADWSNRLPDVPGAAATSAVNTLTTAASLDDLMRRFEGLKK